MSEELSDNPLQATHQQSRSMGAKILLSIGVMFGSIFAFIATQFLATIIIVVVLSGVYGLDTDKIDQLFSENAIMLLVYALSSLLLVAILFLVCLITNRDFLSIVGLKRKPIWSDAAWASLGYVTYFVIFALTAALVLPLLDNVVDVNQQQDLGVSLDVTVTNAVLLFVMFVVIPPIIEEVLFRGFMYRSLRKWMPKWITAIIVSVLFGAMHLELFSGNSPNWIAMIDTTVLSFVLVVLVEKTNSLWSAIHVHALKNFVAYALLLSGIAG